MTVASSISTLAGAVTGSTLSDFGFSLSATGAGKGSVLGATGGMHSSLDAGAESFRTKWQSVLAALGDATDPLAASSSDVGDTANLLPAGTRRVMTSNPSGSGTTDGRARQGSGVVAPGTALGKGVLTAHTRTSSQLKATNSAVQGSQIQTDPSTKPRPGAAAAKSPRASESTKTLKDEKNPAGDQAQSLESSSVQTTSMSSLRVMAAGIPQPPLPIVIQDTHTGTVSVTTKSDPMSGELAADSPAGGSDSNLDLLVTAGVPRDAGSQSAVPSMAQRTTGQNDSNRTSNSLDLTTEQTGVGNAIISGSGPSPNTVEELHATGESEKVGSSSRVQETMSNLAPSPSIKAVEGESVIASGTPTSRDSDTRATAVAVMPVATNGQSASATQTTRLGSGGPGAPAGKGSNAFSATGFANRESALHASSSPTAVSQGFNEPKGSYGSHPLDEHPAKSVGASMEGKLGSEPGIAGRDVRPPMSSGTLSADEKQSTSKMTNGHPGGISSLSNRSETQKSGSRDALSQSSSNESLQSAVPSVPAGKHEGEQSLSRTTHRTELRETGQTSVPVASTLSDGSGLVRDSAGAQRGVSTSTLADRNGELQGGAAGSGAHDTFAALDQEGAPKTNWIHAGAKSAEAGYTDPTLGWVGVRADLGAGGVHASVVPGTVEAAQALGGHMAGLNTYLQGQHTPVETVTLTTPGGADSSGSGDARQQGMEHGNGQAADQGGASESRQGVRTPALSAQTTVAGEITEVGDGLTRSAGFGGASGEHISVMA